MTVGIQLILALVSIATAFVILRSIRKSNLQIEESFFWLLFSLVLLIFAILPNLIIILAEAVGFQSPANFVFLIIIFMLVVNQYRLTKKVSKNEVKLKNLIQYIALFNKENEKNDD
ncbi:DUF2304 domain-containing protein [Streptococcus hongkongensis]|nr:glycosyl transferase [Streptococcus uberis]